MFEILLYGNNWVIKLFNKFCEECVWYGCIDCIDYGGVLLEDIVMSVFGKCYGFYRDVYVDFLIVRDDVKNFFSFLLKCFVLLFFGLSRIDILFYFFK